MIKVKLKTSAEHRYGQTNILPVVNKISFDENGEAEVEIESEDHLERLLTAIGDLSVVKDETVIPPVAPVIETAKEPAKDVVTEVTQAPVLPAEEIKEPEVVNVIEPTKEVSPIAPQTTENEIGKSEDDKNDIGKDEDADSFEGKDETVIVNEEAGDKQPDDNIGKKAEEDASQDSVLDSLSVANLRQLAADSGFPEDEWKGLGKVQLRDYLKSKLAVAAQ